MVRYYGCLSSHSAVRREVVPKLPPAVGNPLLDDDDGQLALGFGEGDENDAPGATRRRPWAWLPARVDGHEFPRELGGELPTVGFFRCWAAAERMLVAP
jgi:hypothetical protein